jgi:homoserine O-succinyltransferase/O-acetyltransferase
MPDYPAKNHSQAERKSRELPKSEFGQRAGRQQSELVIGLLNNMSASALEATERQFTAVLNSASEGIAVRLKRYAFPEIAEGESAATYRELQYESTASLRDGDLDGLIVTGREPLTSNLRDEPYWNSFVHVLEWARENTHSTVWSCLAAHAAVLHMDGIERVRGAKKHSGIFECRRVSEHAIMANVPERIQFPHSRWNGLRGSDLTRCGYQVITQTEGGEVDFFAKPGRSLFLFFQGHPEYRGETLLLEYRRDVGRFLNGESKCYPCIPNGFFDDADSDRLLEIQEAATERGREATLAAVATIISATDRRNGWHEAASSIYRNWLEYIFLRKTLGSRSRNGAATRVKERTHNAAAAVIAEPCAAEVER